MRWGGRGAALFACGLRSRRGRTWQPGAAQVKPACLARVSDQAASRRSWSSASPLRWSPRASTSTLRGGGCLRGRHRRLPRLPTTLLLPIGSRLAHASLPTRACRAPATAPARPAIGRTGPSPTAAGGRSACPAPPCGATRPPLWNLAWGKHFFWDGRAPSLEEQVRMPIEAAEEMGGDWPTILRRLEKDRDLVGQFRAAFPEGSPPYRRTTSSRRSPPTCARWSRRRPGSMPGSPATRGALRPAEVRGFRLFTGKAGCVLCHVGWRFTDDRFHDIGLREPRRRPRRGAGRHAGPAGVQDAEPARARAHGALHARRLAGDARTPSLRTTPAASCARPSLATNIEPRAAPERAGEGRPRRLPAHAVERQQRPRPRAAGRARLSSSRLREASSARLLLELGDLVGEQLVVLAGDAAALGDLGQLLLGLGRARRSAGTPRPGTGAWWCARDGRPAPCW